MRRYARTAIAITFTAVTLAAAGCGGAYSSPAACFRTLQGAGQDKDVAAMMDCVTPETQDLLAGTMVMTGGMLKMFSGIAALGGAEGVDKQSLAAAVAAVLDKHGVTDQKLQELGPGLQLNAGSQAIMRLSDLIADKPAFIADMVAAMEPFEQGQQFYEQMETLLAGTLKDVTVEGETATAIVITRRGEDLLEFRKTGADWKIHFDLDSLPGPGAAALPPA